MLLIDMVDYVFGSQLVARIGVVQITMVEHLLMLLVRLG